LPNYYEILGLPVTATVSDVKSAFRFLAKQYHPDVNPVGKDQFTGILKAYEVLSDPQQKYAYDYRMNLGAGEATGRAGKTDSSAPKEKNWRFDEREMRRRQYYNDHIKKYEKKTAAPATPTNEAPAYNEFKYILFATPLAVLLFVGIMHFANRQSESATTPVSGTIELPQKNPSEVDEINSPYASHFGESYYDLNSPAELTIRNLTGADAVICLFDSARFLRSFFLKDGLSATVPGLPQNQLRLRYCTGKEFDAQIQPPKQPARGAFRQPYGNYKSQSSFDLDAINQLTLLPGINEGFEKIAADEFFKKTL